MTSYLETPPGLHLPGEQVASLLPVAYLRVISEAHSLLSSSRAAQDCWKRHVFRRAELPTTGWEGGGIYRITTGGIWAVPVTDCRISRLETISGTQAPPFQRRSATVSA